MSKRKPTHPIRRIAEDCRGWSNPFLLQRWIAARVKPLLEAYWHAHKDVVELTDGECKPDCADCRLLAAWRAPLD